MTSTQPIPMVEPVAASGLGKRTDLQRHDLSAPGREVIQARVDLDPGYASPKHTHPGEEVIYVLEGTLEYQIEGGAPVKCKAGDALIVPAGAIHWVTNILAAATGRNSRPMSSKKASRSSHW